MFDLVIGKAEQETIMRYFVTIKGKNKYFASLAAAQEACKQVFAQTGIVLGIAKENGEANEN